MRHPKPVPAVGHVRVISPSWPVLFHSPYRASLGDQVMRSLGLHVSYGKYAREITDDGSSAGTAEQRAADFMDAFTDPTVDLVFSAYGGDTTYELLPLLDAERLRRERKAFVGNSDNVWLHQFLLQEADLTSFYGVTYGAEIGEYPAAFPETVDSLRRAVTSAEDLDYSPMDRRSNQFNRPSRPESEQKLRPRNLDGGWQWVRPGRGRGRLVGAELSVLADLVEYFDMKLDGCVLFWDAMVYRTEDLDEKLAQLPLKLAELADRAALDRLAGMLVGPHMRLAPMDWASVVDKVLSAVAPGITCPVVVNADIGHLDPRWVVPYGREAVLDSSRGLLFPRRSGSD